MIRSLYLQPFLECPIEQVNFYLIICTEHLCHRNEGANIHFSGFSYILILHMEGKITSSTWNWLLKLNHFLVISWCFYVSGERIWFSLIPAWSAEVLQNQLRICSLPLKWQIKVRGSVIRAFSDLSCAWSQKYVLNRVKKAAWFISWISLWTLGFLHCPGFFGLLYVGKKRKRCVRRCQLTQIIDDSPCGKLNEGSVQLFQ